MIRPPPSQVGGPTNADQRSVSRRLLDLAAPIIGLNLLNVLALAVDTAMCGRLPNDDVVLAALGFATQVIWLLMVAMMGLTVGTVAMVSRAHGAGDTARVNRIIAQSSLLAVGLGLLVGGLAFTFAEDLLIVLGASAPVAASGASYLRPLVAFTAVNYLWILYQSVFRGMGNTLVPFLVALLANVINVTLNYGLILGNYGFPSLGVQGAAIGTLVAQASGALCLGAALRYGALDGARLELPRPLAINAELLGQLYKIGWPAAVDMLVLNAGFLSIIWMLASVDEAAVAAHGVGLRIQALAFVPGMSISMATAALVGMALGAGEVERARKTLRAALVMCTAVMSTLALIIVLLVDPIIGLYDIDPANAVFGFSRQWILLLGYVMPIAGVHVAFVGILQGAGFTRISLAINLAATVLQIPLSWFFGFTLGWGAWGIWFAFPVSILFKALLAGAAYKQEKWAKTGKTV